ncbi:hypothetical protein OROMI_002907 [Orobanche minor]
MLWEPQSVLGEKYGFEAKCSQLAGKRVIIIFEWFYSCEWEASFLETLEERYIKLKGTSDEFEVIHIVQDKERCIELKADEFGAIHIDQESCRFETKEQHMANLYLGWCSLLVKNEDMNAICSNSTRNIVATMGVIHLLHSVEMEDL